ncbi:ABC transporter ATP-binding protein [Myxococcota bacterium]
MEHTKLAHWGRAYGPHWSAPAAGGVSSAHVEIRTLDRRVVRSPRSYHGILLNGRAVPSPMGGVPSAVVGSRDGRFTLESALVRRRSPGIRMELRRLAPRYAAGVCLIGAYQGAQYWFDRRLQVAVNHVLEQQAVQLLGVELGAVALAAFGLRVFSRVTVFNAGRLAEYELRRALVAQLHRLGPHYARELGTGELISRATNDLGQVRLLFGFGFLNLVNTAFGLISALAVTLGISSELTLASLATLPLLLPATWYFSSQSFRLTRLNQAGLGQLASVVETSFAGVRVVRALGLEPSEVERFTAVHHNYMKSNLALSRMRGMLGPVLHTVAGLGLVVTVWYGGHLMLRAELTPGGFLAFFRAFSRLMWPLVALGFLVSILQRGRAAYARIRALYQAVPAIQDGRGSLAEPPEGALAVNGLSFVRGGRRVLDDVSFHVAPGGSLAVVGRVGAGKSTLAQLIARLLPVPSGTVSVGGTDITELPLGQLRRLVGYAEQSAFLFSTTVAHNIGYALEEPDAPEAWHRIEQAARDAQVRDELAELPDGLNTVVGERGVQLSGGQRQRVSLARALLTDQRLLILDDPLSSVDAVTAEAILNRIDQERARRSLILITHRVAAARRCDRILVLDRGRVAELGTHAELLSRGGLYAHFAAEQALADRLSELGQSGLSLSGEGV